MSKDNGEATVDDVKNAPKKRHRGGERHRKYHREYGRNLGIKPHRDDHLRSYDELIIKNRI